MKKELEKAFRTVSVLADGRDFSIDIVCSSWSELYYKVYIAADGPGKYVITESYESFDDAIKKAREELAAH